MVPLYGKIADIYGRQFTLRIALTIYMVGSLLCALAPNMLALILARALHGLGGGGLSVMGAIVLGDVVAPKERGRYYAYFAVVYTSAGALGPALGGFLAEHLHWSAIFWFNILLGFTALAVTGVLLRRLPRHERPHKLDVIGAVLIVTASISFMLAINLGGVRYPWTSPPILALFALAAALGLLFVRRLLTAPEPLIPIAVLKNRQVRFATGAHAFGWALDRRAQHLHAAVPAERDRPDADRGRPHAGHLHDRAQRQRRHVGLRARPRGALQDVADGRAHGRDLRHPRPGLERRLA